MAEEVEQPSALLDVIEVRAVAIDKPARIELRRGDLTALPEDEAVDVLVLAWFPRAYGPIDRALYEELQGKGISVVDLERNKYIDLRDAFSCWLSHELAREIPGIRFKRLLCFESHIETRGQKPTAVAAIRSIFRALAPFVAGDPYLRSIALPLLATGSQGYGVEEVLSPLLETAVEWLQLGMPIRTIRIYGRSAEKLSEAQKVFAARKATLIQSGSTARSEPKWDVFVSYARQDADAALSVAAHLKQSGFNIFVDQLELEHGAAWQQEIFEVLDDTRIVVSIYSPDYLRSRVCLEEFNIGWARNRNKGGGVMFPIYWRSSHLPTYMGLLNYADCREMERAKLDHACGVLRQRLEH